MLSRTDNLLFLYSQARDISLM